MRVQDEGGYCSLLLFFCSQKDIKGLLLSSWRFAHAALPRVGFTQREYGQHDTCAEVSIPQWLFLQFRSAGQEGLLQKPQLLQEI